MEDQGAELESDFLEALDVLEEALAELEATWGEQAYTQGWPERAASLLAKYEGAN